MFSMTASTTFAFLTSEAKLNRSGRMAIRTLSPFCIPSIFTAETNCTPSTLTSPFAGSITSATAVFSEPTKFATNGVWGKL